MKVSDVICKWYIWAVVGYVIGIKLNDTLGGVAGLVIAGGCLLYTSPSPRDRQKSRMPSSA